MQYNGLSVSELAVSVFNGIMRQRVERPVLDGLFSVRSRCVDVPTETFLERLIASINICHAFYSDALGELMFSWERP